MKLYSSLLLTGLLTGCGTPDRPDPNGTVSNAYDSDNTPSTERDDADPAESEAAVGETGQLDVDVTYGGTIEGRLTVALFSGENPWGWTQDLRELNLPNFPESVRFRNLQPGRYTVLALLDTMPYDVTNPGPEDRLTSVTLTLELDENQVDLDLPEAGAEVVEEPEVPLYSLSTAFTCNCETLRDLSISVHQNEEAPFRSREVINPIFPDTIEFNDLPEGSYRIRWTSTSLGGLSGARVWTLPQDGPVIDFAIEIPQAPPTPEPVLEEGGEGEGEGEGEAADPDGGEAEPGLIADNEDNNDVDLEEEVDFPNRADEAQDWTIGTTILGNLDGFRDFDWFRFTIDEASNLMVGTAGTTDTRCILNDVNGNRVADDDDSGEGNNCRLKLQGLQPGTYLLRISHYSWWGNGEYLLVSDWME